MLTSSSIQAQKDAFAKNPSKFILDHMANRHMWEAHEETHPTKMLNNVLKPGRIGGKFADTQFRRVQNMDLGEDCIKKLLIQHFDAIQAYIQKYNQNPEETPDSALFPMTFTFTRPDGRRIPDYIGTGYRLTSEISLPGRKNGEITGVELVKTNQVGCIIRPSKDNPDGWEISSAFPMASPREAEITPETSIQRVEKDFRPTLHKTFTYQNANPIMQAYLNVTCSGNKIDPKYRTVYSPKTDRRPPIIMITPNFKHPEYKSDYPRITVYANTNPPANATLFLSQDKKMKLGTEKSLAILEQTDPEMFRIYNQITEGMPEEFRPNGTYIKMPNQKEKPKTTRHDPHFDAIASEIEGSANNPSETQFDI